jgi:putative DNA primase/helicase
MGADDMSIDRGRSYLDRISAKHEPGSLNRSTGRDLLANSVGHPATASTPSSAAVEAGAPSEDAMALAFVNAYGRDYRYVAPWSRWYRWDGKRWREDSTGNVFALIRKMIRVRVAGTKNERSTANASYVSGVERLAHVDQRIVALPEDLDADPWLLNTQSGIVDLRTGVIGPHDPAKLCTRITSAAFDSSQGTDVWREFITDITQGDAELADYLQRVAGYCATGVTTEDVLVYLFGIGANGKSSFAEAIAFALGDYAKVFPAEVLMEAKGERHPTDLAQFMGVRFALTSEPASSATWNDSRIKSLTGDATISARFMRGDFFEFARTHKMVVVGNHMPRLADVTHAIRRRVQMVPFRAVFEPWPGQGMRERLKAEAGGAILVWIVQGAQAWRATGTAPPKAVTDLTTDYLSEQDIIGQWLEQRCERVVDGFERSGELHKDYKIWCDGQGVRPKSNVALSAHLVSAGFEKGSTMVGRVFYGLKLKCP